MIHSVHIIPKIEAAGDALYISQVAIFGSILIAFSFFAIAIQFWALLITQWRYLNLDLKGYIMHISAILMLCVLFLILNAWNWYHTDYLLETMVKLLAGITGLSFVIRFNNLRRVFDQFFEFKDADLQRRVESKK